jgi:hypothetical protein
MLFVSDLKVYKDTKCKTPKKNSNVYKDCTAKEGSFSSHFASCTCTNCSLTLELFCHEDEWYSESPNVCGNYSAR